MTKTIFQTKTIPKLRNTFKEVTEQANKKINQETLISKINSLSKSLHEFHGMPTCSELHKGNQRNFDTPPYFACILQLLKIQVQKRKDSYFLHLCKNY